MKILVVQIGRFGDMILTTPLFVGLREAYPDAEIHVLASQRNYEILEGLDCVDVVHIYKKSPVDVMKLISGLMTLQFDLLIDPKDHSSKESALIAKFIKTSNSVGYNFEDSKLYKVGLPSSKENDESVPPLHAVERNMNVLKALGFSIRPTRPIVPVNVSAAARTFQVVTEPAQRPVRVILNLSVGQPDRQWPIEKWLDLGNLIAEDGHSVVVLAAPQDHTYAVAIAEGIGPSAVAFCARNIHETVSMIRRGDVLVTCDSAPVHIASALDVPVVALFRSILWNSFKFYPLSSIKRVEQPVEGDAPIAHIPLVQVFQAVKEAVQEFQATRKST